MVKNNLLFNRFIKSNHSGNHNQILFGKCLGYLISHNGELDGNTITNEIRNRKGTIWCTYPEDSDLSVENSIYDLSVTFITSYC